MKYSLDNIENINFNSDDMEYVMYITTIITHEFIDNSINKKFMLNKYINELITFYQINEDDYY